MTHWRALQTGCGLTLLALHELVQGAAVNMAEVSVCRDATFQIPTSRGAVCSGYGAQPLGVECPRVGDTALHQCHPYLDSFNGVNCVAKEDAQCVHLEGRNVWGCTFPSTSCSDNWNAAPEETARDSCPTWEFSSSESASLSVDPFDVGDQVDCDPAWFTKTTTVTKLYNCKVDTPTPAPIQAQDTAVPTTPSEIPVYTMAPVLTNIMVPQVETVVAAIVGVPEAATSSPSGAPVQTEQITVPPVAQETPVTTEAASLAPTEESPVPTNSLDTPLPPSYPEPTPTETLAATISPTPTPGTEKQIPMPSEVPTSPPATEIPTVAPYTDEVETATPTYETPPLSTPEPEQTWITPTETAAVPTTTAPPVPTTVFEGKPWYLPPIATIEATEPASTTAPPIATLPATEIPQSTEKATPSPAQQYTKAPLVIETLVPTSTPPTETTIPLNDVEPEPQTPESTPYRYNDDTPCPTETQWLTPIFTTSPAPLEDFETDAPTLNATPSTVPYDNSNLSDDGTAETPTSTPTATLAQTLAPTEAIPYTTQPTTTESPTTEVPTIETATSEAPTIETLTTKTPTTEAPTTENPTTEAPVATFQTQYQQEEQQNYQQSVDTTAPPATTQVPTQEQTATVTTTSLSAETPCATVSSNKQTALQTSTTEADLTTIASVSISAAAVIAIIIAIGTILVVTIAIFRVQSRSNQPPPPDPDNRRFEHSIVLTPSDF
ncbi:hypothetical protein GQ600_27243 [Phytophthora cactorum]|nr:hypothetical protein GQ600_27243 [Phytophthora cactorum]